jgi:Peptidase inhibitor I78 family.
MPKIVLLAAALLGACSTAPTVHGQTPGHTCNAAGPDSFVGQAGTSETGTMIKRATNAAVLRWAPPGVMLTMDYREDRVTVWLGPDKRITRIRCG